MYTDKIECKQTEIEILKEEIFTHSGEGRPSSSLPSPRKEGFHVMMEFSLLPLPLKFKLKLDSFFRFLYFFTVFYYVFIFKGEARN